MSYSIDVNGNDNVPEWGYCAAAGCRDDAFPIWEAGEYPDDPDLLLCPKHIGELIATLRITQAQRETKAERAARMRARTDADGQYDHLRSQFERLQTWVARGMAMQPAPPIVLEGVDAALLADLEAAYHALLSYAHGNSAPDLAQEVADKIGHWIGKESGT